MGSTSVGLLSQAAQAKVIKLEKSRFKPDSRKLIINWGSSDLPIDEYTKAKATVINKPENIALASHKLRFFLTCAEKNPDIPIPRFTTIKNEAAKWITEDKRTVFARTILQGHSGAGIVVIANLEELDKIPEGTLLVEYVPKKMEFRIHVSSEYGVVAVQQKRMKVDFPKDKVNHQIRNHQNGYIYAREDVVLPLVGGKNICADAAIAAIEAVGLDFGAVDLIYNERREQTFVLEVNTAPGVEGTTSLEYAGLFKRYADDLK